MHKIIAIYMQVRNLPTRFLSMLNNIYLVALCEVENFKNEYAGIEYVLEHIVCDIKKLETIGIQLSPDMNLKGTLVNFTFDNLGGNSLYGFVEGFNARFYCRICNCHKSECQEMTREDKTELRTVEQYVEDVQNSQERTDDVDTAKTRGVKKY